MESYMEGELGFCINFLVDFVLHSAAFSTSYAKH